MIGWKCVVRFDIEHAARLDAPGAVDQDVIETAGADAVELVGGRRFAGLHIGRGEAGVCEEQAVGGCWRGVEVAGDQDGVGWFALGDPRENDSDSFQACRLGEVEMDVINAEGATALALAQATQVQIRLGPNWVSGGGRSLGSSSQNVPASSWSNRAPSKKIAQNSPCAWPSSRPTPTWLYPGSREVSQSTCSFTASWTQRMSGLVASSVLASASFRTDQPQRFQGAPLSVPWRMFQVRTLMTFGSDLAGGIGPPAPPARPGDEAQPAGEGEDEDARSQPKESWRCMTGAEKRWKPSAAGWSFRDEKEGQARRQGERGPPSMSKGLEDED